MSLDHSMSPISSRDITVGILPTRAKGTRGTKKTKRRNQEPWRKKTRFQFKPSRERHVSGKILAKVKGLLL